MARPFALTAASGCLLANPTAGSLRGMENADGNGHPSGKVAVEMLVTSTATVDLLQRAS